MTVAPTLAPEAPTAALKGAVAVAYVHSDTAANSWTKSMLDLQRYDALHGGLVSGFTPIQYGVDGIVGARNAAVVQALRYSSADWLFWIDTDMGFAPDTVERLMASADPETRPIIGGLCFAAKYGQPDGLNGWQLESHPTIYDYTEFKDKSQGFVPNVDYPKDGLVRCGGTGSACVLIHRSVFSKIEKRYGPGHWYDRMASDSGQLLSEDLSFCMRAAAVDSPIWVDTSVKTSHAKTIWVDEKFYLAQRGDR